MIWAFVVGVVTVLMLVPTVLLLKRSEELGEGKIVDIRYVLHGLIAPYSFSPRTRSAFATGSAIARHA